MRLSRLLRSSAGRAIIGQVFAHMSFAIPVHRLRETATLMAFYHPRPSYPVHTLLVPKKAIAGLAALTPADADFMVDLFSTLQKSQLSYDCCCSRTRFQTPNRRTTDWSTTWSASTKTVHRFPHPSDDWR